METMNRPLSILKTSLCMGYFVVFEVDVVFQDMFLTWAYWVWFFGGGLW